MTIERGRCEDSLMSNGFLSCKCISHLVFCTGLSPAIGVLRRYIHWVYGADMALWYTVYKHGSISRHLINDNDIEAVLFFRVV